MVLLSLQAEEQKEYKKIVSVKLVRETKPVTLYIPKEEVAKKEDENVTKTENQKRFFIGASFGFSHLTHSEDNILGTTTLDVTLEDYATNYGVEGGINLSDDFFLTLNLQYTPLKNVEFYYIYTAFNHRFYTIENVHPYYGLLVGYSAMNWKTTPINGASKVDVTTSSILGGQAGLEVDLTNELSAFFLYKYIVMDYRTLLTSATEAVEIRYTSEQSFHFGLRYAF